MRNRPLTSYVFICLNLFAVFLALLFVSTVSAQQPTEKMIIGGESFVVGMGHQEAIKKLEKCCFIHETTDPRDKKVTTSFIMDKDKTEILGAIWFRNEEVERVERDGEFSDDPEAVAFARSLYRLLSQYAHSEVATVVLQTGTSEATNGSSKFITFIFRDGRSAHMEIVTPDDQQKFHNQVNLKEILEKR